MDDKSPKAGWLASARRMFRVGRVAVMVISAAVAVGIVASLSVDLGPSLRRLAEQQGSQRLQRPLHIGKISIHLLTGRFLVENLVIEGLTPTDRPFFKAGRIVVSMPWWTILRREVLIESVEMTDWQMAVELFPGGRHNFPRFGSSSSQPSGPSRFVTTVQSVHASRGEFTFEDHAVPWSTVARNLDVTVTKAGNYRGLATFSGGTVAIQSYVPMWANMRAEFVINGNLIHFDRIQLETDGAESDLTGDVNVSQWPEQTYQVSSRVHFPRMRELFFAGEHFTLYGDGDFTGTFHIYKGGRELKGRFASDLAGVNDYRFGGLRGALEWLPDRFEVGEASSRFYGGTMDFTYSMRPLGESYPATARFDVTYRQVDLVEFTDFLGLSGIRAAGQASGQNLLEWPLRHFADRTGHGQLVVTPPPGVTTLGRVVPAALVEEAARRHEQLGPFDQFPVRGYLPVSAELTYAYGPEWIEIAPGHAATPTTRVEFQGRTAYGERSEIPFRVTSADWQESDRILAGLITVFGSPTRAVRLGGSGRFEGVMTGAFRRPRVEGSFAGEGMRVWDVVWGSARGSVVIDNGFARAEDTVVTDGPSEIHIDGLFSLSYPRSDGADEIDARIRVVDRPVVDLKHAFELDDYDVSGKVSGEYRVYGKYHGPFGFGRLIITDGVAYKESFEVATAGLRFEGNGVRLDGFEIKKSSGLLTGAAFVGWDGTYSFNADGRRIPVDSLAVLMYPAAPLSGLLQVTAQGSGSFDDPRYEVRARIDDLFVADEGIGQVTGRIVLRGELMSLEVEAASPRLAISGSGRVALTPEADTELSFRVSRTSLDPYIRLLQPRLSPFTTAVASGTVRVVGELNNLQHLLVDATVEELDLSLFDYKVRNRETIHLAFDQQRVRIDRLQLVGEGTQLDLNGGVDVASEQVDLQVTGDANLGILQGFFRDIRSAGAAQLVGRISGSIDAPVFSGSASIADGRLRYVAMPRSFEAINGRVSFGADGIRLDDVTARLGGGAVRLGGRIGLEGYAPGELSITATGQQMELRYPAGIRSSIDADLALVGDFHSPRLTGTVRVRRAVWEGNFETGGGFFGLSPSSPSSLPASPGSTIPLQFDIRIVAPSTLRIENSTARLVWSADLNLRGTYDRPLLFGHAEVERGEAFFEGNRYLIRRATIDFPNPTKIEPFFDVEAETQVRAPGQTYRVAFHAVGTPERFVPELTSDPPLAPVAILSLMLGDTRDPQDAELRALRSPNLTEQELISAGAARVLTRSISAGVGRVVEETFGIDSVQITPSLGDLSTLQSARFNPGARLTIGKRLSDRAYLTFSQGFASSQRDQIILLEFDQSDRLSWLVSQNEDRTYALDFRVRHVF